MFRFLAIIWDPTEANTSGRAAHFSQLIRATYGTAGASLERTGLAVHWAGVRQNANDAYVLRGREGVVLGKLFRRQPDIATPRPHGTLDYGATVRIVESQGQALINDFWGRYVAFIQDPFSKSTLVVRDPIGVLPCFTVDIDNLHLVFSNIEDCLQLGVRFDIDWNYIAVQLASVANERLNGTGLKSVSPIHAGECVEFGRDGVRRRPYWDPIAIATSDVVEDHNMAAEEMYETVKTCIHAWASCYNGILHRLSGGLDSSIVACCLHDAPTRPRITCLNHFSSGGESDERAYARVVANRTGFELVEHPRSEVDLRDMQNMAMHPTPLYARYALENSRFEAALAQERGASAIFSGEWGDALFHIPNHMYAAIDAAWQHGLRAPMFRAALDVARREGAVIWRVLWRSIWEGMIIKPAWDHYGPRLPRHRSMATKKVVDRVRTNTHIQHPWLRAASKLPIGKCKHIFDSLLVDLHPFYNPLRQDDDPDQVAPLNSQPVVELCLRIPTYILGVGGWDRAIARRAFRDSVPRNIITRRTKGDLETFQKEMFTRNADYIRESLLDGALVREGLLERDALKEVLSQNPTRIVTGRPELYWYLCIETWLSIWRLGKKQAAA